LADAKEELEWFKDEYNDLRAKDGYDPED